MRYLIELSKLTLLTVRLSAGHCVLRPGSVTNSAIIILAVIELMLYWLILELTKFFDKIISHRTMFHVVLSSRTVSCWTMSQGFFFFKECCENIHVLPKVRMSENVFVEGSSTWQSTLGVVEVI